MVFRAKKVSKGFPGSVVLTQNSVGVRAHLSLAVFEETYARRSIVLSQHHRSARPSISVSIS